MKEPPAKSPVPQEAQATTAKQISHAGCVHINYVNMHRFLERFQTSVKLFELLERGGQGPSAGVLGGEFIQYRIIAARDGALNIFHFLCSMEAIKCQLPLCCDVIDRTVLASSARIVREARKKFNIHFPNAEQLRHAVAHAGELAKTPEKFEEQFQVKDYKSDSLFISKGGILQEALGNRTYSTAIGGTVCSISIDNFSLWNLSAIFDLVATAMQPIRAQQLGN